MTDSEFPCLDKKASQSAFARLVGVSQPAIKGHVGKVLRQGESLEQWVKTYCEHLRTEAAGRGGDDQASLTRSRIHSENVKAANGLLDYQAKLGNLVQASAAEEVLVEWADYTAREIDSCVEALVHEIESKHDISIDEETVNNLVGAAIGRIGGYAAKLGQRIAPSGSDVPAS